MAGLDSLRFDNRFTRLLPGDPETANFRRQVRGACYSRVSPTAVAKPRLLAYASEVADLLDLAMDPFASDEFAEVFSGNRLLDGMDPFAMCYGGHQFGNWAGQLGDGRAINLGEVVNSQGGRWMLQLKGAGPTPYSRTADGLAVLRSSVREFLCSEAMHHLGVPTTRALSLVLTGEQVVRDMFYDGNPQHEPGAVVCRVAPSFTRFGNFQIFASRRDVHNLRTLVDYTIRTDFPHLGEPSPDTDAAWLTEVCRTTALMIVHWMRVGFVHGVMNTDNMSILGLTIDYGPYGWMDDFDPEWTPNTTDAAGRRYCFGHQPQIAYWNLLQLANALVPLFPDVERLQQALNQYATTFSEAHDQMLAAKLGLSVRRSDSDASIDLADPKLSEELGGQLLEILQLSETDMTIFFRRLADVRCDALSLTPESGSDDILLAPLRDAWYSPDTVPTECRDRMADWLRRYTSVVRASGVPDDMRRASMNRVNPKYVLRNYMAQLAIDKAEQGDPSLIRELLELLRRPYDEQPQHEQYAGRRPDWARHRAGCSMLSCSS